MRYMYYFKSYEYCIWVGLVGLLLFVGSCTSKKSNPSPSVPTDLYFPPIGSTDWETLTPESLGWNTANLQGLYDFLQQNNTRGFIVLKNGRIVLERYYGRNLANTANFGRDSFWYWASAGKTITAFLVGIAQQEGRLSINTRSNAYMGAGWSSLTPTQENQITVKNHLSMTTGLDFTVPDVDCTLPSCLKFRAAAGTQWYYHNAPYTVLDKVIEGATGRTLAQYTQEKLSSRIGMDGFWQASGYNNVYYSSPRSMARYGLLILNKGRWADQTLMTDQTYFNEMVNTSQNLNLSYGYLWWLNGKTSAIYPSLTVPIAGQVAPNAPADAFMAMGKFGQVVVVVPSQNLVVVRMGESPSDGSEAAISFHNEIWGRLNTIIR